jgi:hypothetical protein
MERPSMADALRAADVPRSWGDPSSTLRSELTGKEKLCRIYSIGYYSLLNQIRLEQHKTLQGESRVKGKGQGSSGPSTKQSNCHCSWSRPKCMSAERMNVFIINTGTDARPCFLLCDRVRKNGKPRNHTLANLSKWPRPRIEALRRTLKGSFDHTDWNKVEAHSNHTEQRK